MPRPGPRPYECVRRAWHSDRHQPMRGSLIQEMFRVVSEAHSPATRRNREWQEKLPCVVLRAEEIMYSKANSEAEYMDPKTLWDRANDAIDTIIRRDDHESPDLLHPCIEAALNLGCIPRRASRSQRHSNPGCYLSSNAARNVSREIPDHSKSHHGLSASALAPIPHSTNLQSATSLIGSWYRDSHSSPIMNSGCREFVSVLATSAGSELNGSSTSSISELPLRSQNAFLSRQHTDLLTPVETCIWPSNGCVYPLYYRDREPKTGTRQLIEMAQGSNYTKATSTSSSMEPIGEVQVDFLHDFLGSNLTTDMLRATSNVDEPCTYPSSIGCDLSLSLAPSGMVTESTLLHRIEDMGSSSSCQDKSYRLLPKDKTVDPLESCSSK